MLQRQAIQALDDYFRPLSNRPAKGVYVYRINGYTNEIETFIKKYYEQARRTGVVIEGRLPNPDEKQLAYYEEIMGLSFELSLEFMKTSLRKWLLRMHEAQRNQMAEAMYEVLLRLKQSGKTENMLKNAYIKFMCWLYYKLERVVNQLGSDAIAKILYEGEISNYELLLLSVLARTGCDVVLLQYHGDAAYQKIDPSAEHSIELQLPGMGAFPQGFCVANLREQASLEMERERMYGPKPSMSNCTNAWIKELGLEDIKTSPATRGTNPNLFYNCFYRICGVEDKVIYINELYQFQQELKHAGRSVVILNQGIQMPGPEEIASIRRGNYQKVEQLIMDLSGNINYAGHQEIQRLMRKAFVDLILEEAEHLGDNLNKLTSRAVILLCWLKRFGGQLFGNWTSNKISCLIHLGACTNEQEALFLRLLARLPVDVLILCPDLSQNCCVTDELLFEKRYEQSMRVTEYPQEGGQVSVGTAAYHAERELDTLMYQDSGMYRNQQYTRANTINLQTMYEEIKILWDQELKFRPNFATVDGMVNLPVIFAKVCGVKNGQLPDYWLSVRQLVTEDTLYIPRAPYIKPTDRNPIKMFAPEFYKNGRLQKKKIRQHPNYPYGFLREEMQEYMLDKLALLIEQKKIKGTFENGTEYTIIATVLNLGKDIVRMIQKFDFTKKNPKLVYINTTEAMISLEDSIVIAYLNLIGFDIICFVPTGYQNVEKYFNGKMMEEHQIGEYMYDLQVPDLNSLSLGKTKSWWKDLFKRK